jgi:hypothetical protein
LINASFHEQAPDFDLADPAGVMTRHRDVTPLMLELMSQFKLLGALSAAKRPFGWNTTPVDEDVPVNVNPYLSALWVRRTVPAPDVTRQPLDQLPLIGANAMVSLRFIASLLAVAKSLTKSSAADFEFIVPMKFWKLGAASAARIPKIVMTTNTSISVNPRIPEVWQTVFLRFITSNSPFHSLFLYPPDLMSIFHKSRLIAHFWE